MSETTQDYVTRVLGYLGTRDPMRVLASTPSVLASLIDGVSPATLRRQPAPGKWSVGEILAHLADTEMVMGYRVRRILETDGASLDAFDQNRWAAIGRYGEQAPADSLERLRTQRLANVALLESLTPSQWAQAGLHPERGREPITRIRQLWAGHDLNHTLQVERIVKP